MCLVINSCQKLTQIDIANTCKDFIKVVLGSLQGIAIIARSRCIGNNMKLRDPPNPNLSRGKCQQKKKS